MNKWIVLLLALTLILTACGTIAEPEDPETSSTMPTQLTEVTASGNARLVITGMEWGPVISKIILKLDCSVCADSVDHNGFSVRIPGEDYHGISEADAETTPQSFDKELTVLEAYTCDQCGDPSGDSNYIALELAYDPGTPAPMISSQMGRVRTFCEYYDLIVSVREDAGLLTADGAKVTELIVPGRLDMRDASFHQLENVSLDGSYTGSDGITLTYVTYSPKADGKRHPLVIWLHGGGEGGTDVRSVIYGNEVTALFGEEFQNVMGGAYVLMPQSPTMWMEQEENGHGSVYRETLMELIQDYVNHNPHIDPNRIYVGGCSNGGFMTIDLLLHYPDYFAAAYPICGVYDNENIADDQLKALSCVPMWFICAENDPVVNSKDFMEIAHRLRNAGAEVHISLFEDVHDTSGQYKDADGSPHQYIGHWSWIWFFNNECVDGDLNMWQWMARQKKP